MDDRLIMEIEEEERNADAITERLMQSYPEPSTPRYVGGDNITDLVNQRMEAWDQETDGGLSDPAFQGELGQDIDLLVGGLKEEEVGILLKNDSPLFFMCSSDNITIDRGKFEHLLNCMCNQKFVREMPLEVQREWQGIIDKAYHEARGLLSKQEVA